MPTIFSRIRDRAAIVQGKLAFRHKQALSVVVSAPTIVKLPAELMDRIIDFLHSDKRTLSACSLVCKSWVPSSRYHLFRDLTIPAKFELFELATDNDVIGVPPISNVTIKVPKGLEVFNYVQSVS
jgi:hypothetical protein